MARLDFNFLHLLKQLRAIAKKKKKKTTKSRKRKAYTVCTLYGFALEEQLIIDL